MVTTVHRAQIVERLPRRPNDLPIRLIITPEETIEVPRPPPAPRGVDWSLLDEERLREMPVLLKLRERIGQSLPRRRSRRK